jgi:hypothetical protein
VFRASLLELALLGALILIFVFSITLLRRKNQVSEVATP